MGIAQGEVVGVQGRDIASKPPRNVFNARRGR
jgi:hypothetical protein